ncbi:hypothetical protein QQS45_03005 [Alteriqipengyuania flavescens]|uniref:hypothetical protein n=1 Tax=Alteriqipengyuania flavescens TaxID=3053610 RepID=UPI0025B34936|nr:hypothetical protein [Alteriqipengyuania flavescens]WJY19218.1 hypothetical protein QQW98_03000 [Alteriqipengyuania flavescens]WJY25158.1 hypothetical protein QQS45_03005 [Alteriqipengyuania flavescens]
MSAFSFKSSRPDSWTQPRAHQDPILRDYMYGKIQPMEEPRGIFSRLFGMR